MKSERAITTNTTEINNDMRNTQKNDIVDHTKYNGSRQRNNNEFNAYIKNASNNGETQKQQENISRPPRKF